MPITDRNVELTKISMFDQNCWGKFDWTFDFWQKFRILTEISTELLIFEEILTERLIFDKSFEFWRKLRLNFWFLKKVSNFDGNFDWTFDFWGKLDHFLSIFVDVVRSNQNNLWIYIYTQIFFFISKILRLF